MDSSAGGPSAPLAVRYLDSDLVVVSKPAGMLMHRSSAARGAPLLLQHVRDQLARRVYPVHRLDRATSGLVAFAFDSDGARRLQQALADPATRKEYLVLARGETPDHFASTRPLGDERGVPQEAHTEFTRLAVFSRCTLLAARLHTGRRHQIRRHLDHLAHQVIGDTTHGKGRINRYFRAHYGLPRLFLHAALLAFGHPRDGARMTLCDPLPADLCGFLLRLPDVDPLLVAQLAGDP